MGRQCRKAVYTYEESLCVLGGGHTLVYPDGLENLSSHPCILTLLLLT